MTSSSSLYGTSTTQNVSSTNSTSLYGEAGSPIPDASGNVIVRGDLYVLSGNILTTATTGNIFPANATTINLGLAATAVNIGANTGTTTINNNLVADSGDFGNITIGVVDGNTIATTSGDLNLLPIGNNGVNITSGNDAPTLITRNSNNTNTSTRSLALAVQSSGTPAVGFGNNLEWQLETAPGNTESAGYISVVSTDLTVGSEDFKMSFGLMQNGAAYSEKAFIDSTGSLTLDNNLTVGGVNINLAPSANFLYSEANDRLNRPEVQSTSGNSSGFRVRAPNTGTSAASTLSVNNSSDSANTEFLALQARGSALGDTFRFLTGEYIANVFSASNKSISFTDYTNTYATVNPAGPTIGTDLVTIDSLSGGTFDPVFNSVTADFVYTEEVRAKTDDILITTQPGGKAQLGLYENVTNPDGLAIISVNSNLWYFIDDGRTQFPNYIFPAADGAANTVLTTDGAGNVTWALPGGGGSTFGNITVAVVNDNTISTTTGDLDITATGNNGVNITSGSDAPTLITRNTTNTNTGTRSLALSVQSSGTPAVGFGNSLEWQVETAPGTTKNAGYAVVNITDLTPGSEDFSMGFGLMQNGAAAANRMTLNSAGNLTTVGDLTVGGTNVNLEQDTGFLYNENNSRLNRPYVQSTSGNSSGFRVKAPNATTSASSSVSVGATDDPLNTKFLSIQALGSVTEPLRIVTGEYIAGVFGPSGDSISIRDGVTQYATINPAGPTVGTDLTTKTYVDGLIPVVPTYDTNVQPVAGGAELDLREIVGASFSIVGSTQFIGGTNVTITESSPNVITIAAPDTNTTYDFNATSTTGGANLNLVGSDATTDTVKLTNGGHITATYTSGTEVTLGSDATDANTASAIVARDASGNFSASGATLGNVTVGVDSDQIVSTSSGNLVLQTAAGVNAGTLTLASGTNGDITLAPNGTGTVVSGVTTMLDASRVYGQAIATRNTTYVPPVSALTTLTGSNGLVVSSSTGGANGYGANIAVRYHTGDTTAAGNNAAAVITSGATGTSAAPAGVTANLVLGAYNFDGYTAGTSNNYASQIATPNQGAGTTAIQPLQLQGYARQAFTNSTTVTTAVTGASGTGSVATLTFTTQNTAPYAVGQTVAIAGMTPAGYNTAAAVITVATTSSISYANATTGFTSGGTIAAVNTVTAAGMGFRIRGYANSTNLTAANRFNFMDLTASAATFKSNAYTFANEVITGSTLTATNYMTLASTGTVLAAPTTGTYASMAPGSTTFTNSGISQMIRQGTVNTTVPAILVRYQRTDTADSNDGDGVDFRLSTAGTVTTNNIARFDAQYKATGLHTVGISVSTDSFAADTDTIYRGQADKTTIRATPTGTTGTASDILTVESTKITAAVPIKFPTYTAAAANAITGAVGWQISISNSAGGGNPNGMMAFWDTTNVRWSYIHDNSAV